MAYLSRGQVMLWTEGQGARALGAVENAEQIRLSDDGQVVVALALGGTSRLTALYADGSDPRILVGSEAAQAVEVGVIAEFGFAPASHSLYVVTDVYDLLRIDADTGAATRLFPAGSGGFMIFSPDGQWMTLYHPNEVVLARTDGSTATTTALTFPEGFSYTMMGPQVVWAADSSGFTLASATGNAPQGEPDAMAVWFVPVLGEPVRRMSYAGTYGAHLSPDGQRVVYLDPRKDPVEVHLVDADGSDTLYGAYRTQDVVNLQCMGWAPDGEQFVLNLSDDGRLPAPYVAAGGQEPVRLTDVPYAGDVRWVDAERVLYVSYGEPEGPALRLQRLGSPSLVVDRVQGAAYAYAYTAIQ